MPLYICNVPNPLLKQGRYYEDNHDGFVQEVRVWNENGRLMLGDWVGLAIPTSEARPFLVRIQSKGVDRNVRDQLRIEIH